MTDAVGPDQGVQRDAALGALDCDRGDVDGVQRHLVFEDVKHGGHVGLDAGGEQADESVVALELGDVVDQALPEVVPDLDEQQVHGRCRGRHPSARWDVRRPPPGHRMAAGR
ncbi:MAG: hypothetical protein JWR58_6267 [Pseudonocardia sp.]|nr:hypothetical protein [Pseudonocardia sp.]